MKIIKKIVPHRTSNDDPDDGGRLCLGVCIPQGPRHEVRQQLGGEPIVRLGAHFQARHQQHLALFLGQQEATNKLNKKIVPIRYQKIFLKLGTKFLLLYIIFLIDNSRTGLDRSKNQCSAPAVTALKNYWRYHVYNLFRLKKSSNVFAFIIIIIGCLTGNIIHDQLKLRPCYIYYIYIIYVYIYIYIYIIQGFAEY